MNTTDLIFRLANALSRTPAERAYLFGSYARGEADAWSDVDLVVVAPSQRSFVDRFQDFLPLWEELRCGLDLFVYTPAEWAAMGERGNCFVERVLKEGRVIYEGSSPRS